MPLLFLQVWIFMKVLVSWKEGPHVRENYLFQLQPLINCIKMGSDNDELVFVWESMMLIQYHLSFY